MGKLPAGLGILWSLAVEEHYYLLFPLLYTWFVRRSIDRKRQAAVLIALCIAALCLALLSRFCDALSVGKHL